MGRPQGREAPCGPKTLFPLRFNCVGLAVGCRNVLLCKYMDRKGPLREQGCCLPHKVSHHVSWPALLHVALSVSLYRLEAL